MQLEGRVRLVFDTAVIDASVDDCKSENIFSIPRKAAHHLQMHEDKHTHTLHCAKASR